MGRKTKDVRLPPAVAKDETLVANLKPARIRGVESQGMSLEVGTNVI